MTGEIELQSVLMQVEEKCAVSLETKGISAECIGTCGSAFEEKVLRLGWRIFCPLSFLFCGSLMIRFYAG